MPRNVTWSTRKIAVPVGSVFGRLTVTGECPERKHGHRVMECQCSCGVQAQVTLGHLRTGDAQSCGCLARDNTSARNTTHGKSSSKIYRLWRGIRSRCEDTGHHAYKDYGGRGITVCDRWKVFENFLADMGERPDGRSIERRNNNEGYSKDNCYWANKLEQGSNMRSNILIPIDGQNVCIAEASRRSGVKAATIRYRHRKGWPVHHLLSPTWSVKHA